MIIRSAEFVKSGLKPDHFPETASPGDRFCRSFQCRQILPDQYLIEEKSPGADQPQTRSNPYLEFFFDQ